MCVIVFKPDNSALPKKKYLQRCFEKNGDGAGYAVNKNGKNYINKGFFDFKQFYIALINDFSYSSPMLIHFQNSTNSCVEKCNPFPLTRKLSMLRAPKLETHQIVIAHDGWLSGINSKQDDISDVMSFIIHYLAIPVIRDKILNEKSILDLLRFSLGKDSFAFLAPDGRWILLGDFEKHKRILYSNDDYKNVIVQSVVPYQQRRYDDDYRSWYTPKCFGIPDEFKPKDTKCISCVYYDNCLEIVEEEKSADELDKEEYDLEFKREQKKARENTELELLPIAELCSKCSRLTHLYSHQFLGCYCVDCYDKTEDEYFNTLN